MILLTFDSIFLLIFQFLKFSAIDFMNIKLNIVIVRL